MKIKVKNCAECPFMFENEYGNFCNRDLRINLSFYIGETQGRDYGETVHENCPLKGGSIKVSLVSAP